MELTEPGPGRHVFTFTVPKGLELVKKYNRLLLIANFRNDQGKDWPWSVRAENEFVRKRGFYEIETEQPGHLFTYDEPVRLAIRLKNVKTPGEKKTLHYTIHDTSSAPRPTRARWSSRPSETDNSWQSNRRSSGAACF